MKPIRRNYDVAGAFVMLSGLLYLPVFLLEGLGPRTKVFIGLGIVLIALGLWVRGRRRWLAYILYVLMLFVFLGTLIAMGTSSIGAWWWVIILVLNLLAIYHLFRILWADKIPT